MANPMLGMAGFFGLTTVIGGVVMYKGYKQLTLKRLIENLPTSKVRSIAMGLVELKGAAQKAQKTITAPFTGKDCMYSYWIVEEQYHDKDGHEHWKTIASGNEGVQFYLKDETGKVLVDPVGADLQIPTQFEASSSLGRDPPAQVLSFLKEKKISFEGFLGINKTMRYREARLEPGIQLYVLGNAMTNPESKGSAEHTENILIGKGAEVFIITDKEEKKLVFWSGVSSAVGIILGGLLAFGSFIVMIFMAIAGLAS